MKNKIVNRLSIIIPVLFIGIIFYTLTSNAPLVGIDNYQAVYNTNGENINLFFLISRALTRCFNWNARVGEFIYFVLGPLPHIIHDILNTCFFLYFIWLIFKYAFDYEDIENKNYKNFWWIYLLIAALIFMFEPVLWEDFFWMADSCNHLWGLCILMTAFLPFRKFSLKSYEVKGIKLFFYSIACFIAGTVSENIVPFIIGLIVLIIFFKYKKEKKIYLWTCLSLGAFILGYLWLMLCSSTKVRYDFFANNDWSLSTKIYSFSTFFYDYKFYFIITLILFIIFLIRYFILKKKNKTLQLKKSFKYNTIFYLLSFVSFFVLLFSPYYVTRALLIITFSSFTINVYLINELLNDKKIIYKILLSIICIFIYVIYSIHIKSIFIDYNKFDSMRDEFIRYQIDNNNSNIIVPLYDRTINWRYFVTVEYELCNNNIVRNKYSVDKNIEIICSNEYRIR